TCRPKTCAGSRPPDRTPAVTARERPRTCGTRTRQRADAPLLPAFAAGAGRRPQGRVRAAQDDAVRDGRRLAPHRRRRPRAAGTNRPEGRPAGTGPSDQPEAPATGTHRVGGPSGGSLKPFLASGGGSGMARVGRVRTPPPRPARPPTPSARPR